MKGQVGCPEKGLMLSGVRTSLLRSLCNLWRAWLLRTVSKRVWRLSPGLTAPVHEAITP